jgi:cytochrome c5
MFLLVRAGVPLLCLFVWLLSASSVTASAADGDRQSTEPQAKTATQSSAEAGKDTLNRKCFQCHAATMWSSLRLDRRAWESTLYRMVGRGALWTEEEISSMAAFLAETRGPK